MISPNTRLAAALIASVAAVLLVEAGSAIAFRGGGFRGGGFRGGDFGGFHGADFGGFHGGFGDSDARRFGDGGLFDHVSDTGFGRGGWGSIHNASAFSDRADSFAQSHPEWRQNATQFQSNRFTEANQLQSNRISEVNNIQTNRISTWDNYRGAWGGYYAGLGFGAGFGIGATIAALPAAAIALNVAGNPYYYWNGIYYQPQGGQYAIVGPPEGAVVATPPPSCASISLSGGESGLDCGGAFYASGPGGYRVIAPPIGVTVSTLPPGAKDRTVDGVTYFAYGGAYYRPVFSGSGVAYQVVAQPA